MQYKELTLLENYPLKEHTTFHIGGNARFFVALQKPDDIQIAFQFAKEHNVDVFLLGAGSNVLISDSGFSGLVICLDLFGKALMLEDKDTVTLRVAAGEVWDEVVEYCVTQGWWGIENLSHIPGKMGAFAVQNVGAYGQEASQVVKELHAYDIQTGEYVTLTNTDCQFAYRKSIFNTTQKGRYIIVSVDLVLHKIAQPSIAYPDLQTYFKEKNIASPSALQIRETIISIRDKKFTQSNQSGSAGSFFKNVYLSREELQNLDTMIARNFSSEVYENFKKMRNKFSDEGKNKIPAAFLIDICRLKGRSNGGARIHEKQPLVIINEKGDASSHDVLKLMQYVRDTVYEKTGIILDVEPQCIGFTQQELERYFEVSKK